MRYKYINNLTVLELMLFAGLLLPNYYLKQHIASDIGIDEHYVPADSLTTQANLDQIVAWTEENQMKLNEDKSKYMVFTRSNTVFATRLTLNGNTMERIEEVKLVGVWLTTFLDWDKNTRELCRKAYARMTMLTKLKYVGTSTQDLIEVYILYIRSILEYCAVVWHSTLTSDQSKNLENVQKLCLKIITGPDYTNYEEVLDTHNLEKLSDRRQARCLKFGLKSLLHPVHSKMFPVNQHVLSDQYEGLSREHFEVNWAKTESYRMSTVPYVQRLLNGYVKNQKK